MKKLSLAPILFFVLTAIPSSACLHFDKEFDPTLFEEKEKEALLFHDGEFANLVIKTSFKGKLPGELSWVLPLPSKPESFEEVDPEIFSDLTKLSQLQGRSSGEMLRGGSKGLKKRASAIKVHPPQSIGNYTITPIEIVSESGGSELNSFLDSKGFNSMPEELQKPYVKKGAYFLAVSMSTPKVSNSTKESESQIKPLWIRYKSNALRFPLRFTHDTRTFGINLYFYTFEGMLPLFDIAEGLTSSWGTLPWLNLADREKDYKALHAFLNEKSFSLTKDEVRRKALFDRLLEREKKIYNQNQLSKLNFKTWNPSFELYRLPIVGVNKNFKTRDLKEDPGLQLF